jgi:hypothetical protein
MLGDVIVDPDPGAWIKGVSSLMVMLLMIGLWIWAFRRGKESKSFADEALRQNARLVELNERMVELLESIDRRGSNTD